MINQPIAIPDVFREQKSYFAIGQTRSLAFRKEQLHTLKKLLQQNEEILCAAIFEDFGRSEFDTYTTELALVYHDIEEALNKLHRWAKPKRVGTNFVNFPAKSYVVKEPIGTSLIIGAWNYPYMLALSPAVAAIAAGCTVVLKPSELPVRTSAILASLIKATFPPGFFTVVEGGVTETTELLTCSWDKIFFTGSVPVGKIVYQAAAKNLIPVTLELGGKSPAIVTKHCNLKMTAKRLVWAKFLNAGQTCVAPDYVLVDKLIADALVEAMVNEIKKENYNLANGNYVQIINEQNLERLAAMIEPGLVVAGGAVDRENRVISPTILYPSKSDSLAMKDEIFGPLLPVLVYDNLVEAFERVKERPKPLSAYIFTENSKEKKRFLSQLSFGGGAINDAVMHISNSKLPFGGVGQSGMGAYHGEAGFQCFSHSKSVLQKSTLLEFNLKYFPHSSTKFKWIKRILKLG
jgi:aldehyde dehydrogenase (NAD+)